MPARSREVIQLKCPSCGRTGTANVGYGSERVSASAVEGFIVIITDEPNKLLLVCDACKTTVREVRNREQDW